MKTGGSYDRKLEDVLVARLKGGAEAESLLAELRTRLDGEAADAVLARAEVRTRTHTPPPLAQRVLVGLAYLWTALLVLQNLMIVMSLAGSGAELGLHETEFFIPFLSLTLLKVGALCGGVFAYKRWRSAYTTALYGLALLFAFPLGLYANAALVPGAEPPDALTLVSASALCTYAAVVLIALVYWLGRAPARSAAEADVFS